MFLRSKNKLVSLNKQIVALGLASSGLLMCLSVKANAETLKVQDSNQAAIILAEEATEVEKTEEVDKTEEVESTTPSVNETDSGVDPNSNDQADNMPTDTTVPTTPTDETVPTTPTDSTVPTTPTDTTVPTTPTEETVPTTPTEEVDPTTPTEGTNPTDEESPTDDVSESKSIVETAKSEGSFTTLTKALEAAGLIETLEGKGPFTVFAPTDEAFAALPEETLEKLLMPENKEQLIKVLTYHVVSGTISFKDITDKQEGQVPTVEGTPLDIVAASSSDITVNEEVKVIQTDVSASNGVIQVVDKVILPPDLKLE